MSTVSRCNWNLEAFVFVEGGKPENQANRALKQNENQQQTQPS